VTFCPLTFVCCLSTSLCLQVLRGGQVFPQKQHDFVSNGLWGGPAERQLRDTGPIAAADGSSRWLNTHTQDVCCTWRERQASACLQYFLKTPLSAPKDSIVNVLLPYPNTEQLQVLMYSCACLAEHCIACMFFWWNLFRNYFIFIFLLEMVIWRVCTVCFLCIYKLEQLFYEM